MKNTNLLTLLMLTTFIFSSVAIMLRLETLSNQVTKSGIPKMQISDGEQFYKLSNQLAEQWHANGYAVYILQPNSPIKTHKELVTTTFDAMPIMLDIKPYDQYMKLHESSMCWVGDKQSALTMTYNTSRGFDGQFVMIPVYRHNIIIAEFFVEFKDGIPDNIDSMYDEAQQLSKLIN